MAKPGAIKESLAEQVRAVLEKDAAMPRPPARPRRGQAAAPPAPLPAVQVDISQRGGPPVRAVSRPSSVMEAGNAPPVDPVLGRQYMRARAIALTGQAPPGMEEPNYRVLGSRLQGGATKELHWAYEGETGPQAWARLNPDFRLCANGQRQSPIHIETAKALQGPAEPLQFSYQPSLAEVVNTGHTIQVNLLQGENTLTVRGAMYKLVQFHFHHPAEERIDGKGFALVAHLVHRSAEGQLAVVAVLLDPGEASTFLGKVWTYMPLDVADRVRTPAGWVDVNELLPQDRRYYQFFGSLTTPPCSEGVLWMVLKQPMTLDAGQLRMFSQQFPNNARPVQSVNGRVVREAQ